LKVINFWGNQRLAQFLFLSIILTPLLPPVALLCIATAVLWHRKKYRFVKDLDWPEKAFIGFMLISAVSWLVEPSWFYGIPVGLIPIAMFGLYWMLAVWIRHLNWSWQEVQKTYLAFWLSGLYIAVIVFIQQMDWHVINDSFVGNILQFYNDFRFQSERSVRSIGTSGNSNLTAALLICFSLMSIYAASVLKKKWHKLTAFLIFGVYVTAIWCTGSRGAWAGLLIGLIVQLWMTGHRKRTVTITLAIFLLISCFPELIPRKETLQATIEVRLEVWTTAFKIFREHWLLGVLPLHFGQLFVKEAGFYVYHAHNIFLGVASEFGVLGLGLFLWMLLLTIQRARRWRKVANQKEEKRLAGMLLSLTIALLGHGMYDYPIIAPQIGLMFMLSVIIIHTQYVRRCVNKPDWSKPSEPEPELPAFSERKVISWILLFIPYEVMYWIYRFFVHRKIE
jgi:hypothetical protein